MDQPALRRVARQLIDQCVTGVDTVGAELWKRLPVFVENDNNLELTRVHKEGHNTRLTDQAMDGVCCLN